MGKIAFLFPGQGAQCSGMGRDLFGGSRAAREVFTTADKIRRGTSDQCFDGTEEELSQTANTQPCLFCADLAAAASLAERGVRADMLAGFSLGEIAALTFSGAVTYENGFRLVCCRGELMQHAAETSNAAMLAVMKLEDDTVRSICGEFEAVYPVNFNCRGQVVVSGKAESLNGFKERVRAAGGKTIPLKVSGGFHSPFMAEAAEKFGEVLKDIEIGAPLLPLYANVTGKPYSEEAAKLLAKQICSPVLWRETIENMIGAGADTFIEVGPGNVLGGLVSRISSDVRVFGVRDMESLKKTIAEVSTIA